MIESRGLEVDMARKRLSDLLREEEQKSGENAAEQTQPSSQPSAEEDVQPEAEKAIPATAEVIAAQAEQVDDFVADLRSAAAEPEEPQAEPETKPDPEPASHHRPTKADLEAIIVQLKGDLESASQTTRTQTAALHEQITQLQAQIATQEATIQQLQTEVQQAEKQSGQLKTELESARQMILQLSQINKPAESPKAAPSPKPPSGPREAAPLPKPLSSPRAAEPELEPTRSDFIIPAGHMPRSAANARPRLHEMALKKVLDHPIQPGSLPPMSAEAKPAEKETVKLTDADVGWMD